MPLALPFHWYTLVWSPIYAYVVIVNRKRRHDRSPWCHALRGHHIDHSDLLEKQGILQRIDNGEEPAIDAVAGQQKR